MSRTVQWLKAMRIFQKEEIQKYLDTATALDRIEEGFVIYSNREAVVPPVATLHFDHPPGDCHIKYGYAKQGRYYVAQIRTVIRPRGEVGCE